MKILINYIIITGLLIGNLYADNIITYGKSTFEDVDSRIIFGSYGDEYSVSTFGKLGANDFIAELNFKNVLAYEGYTEAYDYNPAYDGYYNSFYRQKPPANKDLTKLSIRGLGANPREVQDVYILTKEYEKYSSQHQDLRINENNLTNASQNIKISNNLTDIQINTDNILKNNSINSVQDVNINNNSNDILVNANDITLNTNQNILQDIKINTNTDNIDTNNTNIINNTNQNILQDIKINTNENNINTNTTSIINNTNEITQVDNTSKDRDNLLDNKIINNQNDIVDIDNKHTTYNNTQNLTLDKHNKQLNHHESRIGDLEETQVNVMGELQFIRERNYTVGIYSKYDVRHSNCPEAGIKITVGIGKSWTEKEMDKINVRLAKIEALMKLENKESPTVIKTKKGYRLQINPKGVATMKGNF